MSENVCKEIYGSVSNMTTLRIVSLPSLFRLNTSHHYPPFKNGRYMEEYIHHYLEKQKETIVTPWIYLPIYWTAIQNHPSFHTVRYKYEILLQQAIRCYPKDSVFFTCVQHDDGPQLALPPNTHLFGACSGQIPLPLIYEDTTLRLSSIPRLGFHEKDILASFVGTLGTHPLRKEMYHVLKEKKGVYFSSREVWSPSVDADAAQRFIEITQRSRFCLAPRGYGRSSFRFFEAMMMDVIPVYVWDDIEWLPYKESRCLEYSRFSISIHCSELPLLYDRLVKITEEEYQAMIDELRHVRRMFELEGMCEWLVQRVR